MILLLKFYKYFFILSILALLQACGSGDGGKVSKGHRDAIRFECKDSSDVKACGLEVRENFLESGNDFITFEECNMPILIASGLMSLHVNTIWFKISLGFIETIDLTPIVFWEVIAVIADIA